MYKTTSILLASLMMGTTALAGHGSTSIIIDNRFDGKADVFIDGYFSGEIRGDTKMSFKTRPGNSDVLVLRDGGAVLLNKRIHSHQGESTTVRVIPPEGTLNVRNTGRAPLLVTADSRTSWISPGTSTNLVVTTGNVRVTSKIEDRYGRATTVDTQTVWLEPGKRGNATVKYEPPARTGITIKNRDHHTLQVRIGNRDYGMVRPGAEMFASVEPGYAWVTVSRVGGPVKFSGNVAVKRGADSKVVVDEDKSGKVYKEDGKKLMTWDDTDDHDRWGRHDDRHDHSRSRWRWRW